MARGFVSTVSFTLERLKGVGVFKTHGEEVMARSFLFGVQERAEFVDSRAEVGWVTAESDLERLGKRPNKTQHELLETENELDHRTREKRRNPYL